MKPDRTNYEIWLVDYLDGNLSGEQAEQLLYFLDENPDIKEESEGLSSFTLPIQEVSFGNKNKIKRPASELSDSQFEILCAASLENDLSADQKSELAEAILADTDRKMSAGLFSKTKLFPPQYNYRYKHRLKKLTLTQRVFRISIIGLSAAASILLLFTVIKNTEVNTTDSASGYRLPVTGGNNKRNGEKEMQAVINVPDKKEKKETFITESQLAKNNEIVITEKVVSVERNSPADTSRKTDISAKNNIEKIGGITGIPSEKSSVNLSLVSLNLTAPDPLDEGAGNAVGNFFTRIIREKILKSDSPGKGNLKAYEVADAGITGINKLFGSNMTLKKTLDDKGEVRSVYFNSKLLKFNAPVKKAEPME